MNDTILAINVYTNISLIKDAPLENGSYAFKEWNLPSDPTYLEVWVFNLVNPMEVVYFGERPFVTQKGPYTYR